MEHASVSVTSAHHGARQPLGFPITGKDLLGPFLLFLALLLSLGFSNL